jgi:hypothetical protein
MASNVALSVFDLWDSDSDGFIRKPELKSVLLTLGLDMSEVEDTWLKADVNNDGFLDYTRFTKWIWSDDAPVQIKDEITSWIMDGSGKTKSNLSDWTFHPWILAKDKAIVTELTLRGNGSFEEKTVRLSVKKPDGDEASAPFCAVTGSGTWEVDMGDCILHYADGRVDGYTLSKLMRLHEANKP